MPRLRVNGIRRWGEGVMGRSGDSRTHKEIRRKTGDEIAS
jgi:hypothetical protein